MDEQTSNPNPGSDVDPEIVKHKIVKKEILTIISIFIVMSIIVGILEYFEKTSGLVTRLSEILVNKLL